MANSNPLLQQPFFLIPGIDPSAPVSAQTEQVDQLNTLLLQEIDANFAKFHQIIIAKVLPEIKRFALASEPTREAANFWRTFFEAASAVRLPTSELTMTMDQSGSHAADASYAEDEDHTLTGRRDATGGGPHHDLSLEGEGSSIFAPAASSTPLPSRQHGGGGGGGGPGGSAYAPGFAAYDESFADSMESPFDRLDRRMQSELNLSAIHDDESSAFSSLPSHLAHSAYEEPSSSSAGHISVGAMGMDLGATERNEAASGGGPDTPRASRAPSSQPGQGAQQKERWTGLTDLRSTPLNAKFKLKSGVKMPSSNAHNHHNPSGSREIDLHFGGQSGSEGHVRRDSAASSSSRAGGGAAAPKFTLPPRAAAIQQAAARTPVRSSSRAPQAPAQAGIPANLILDDIMSEMESDYLASPGAMRTPEGLRRYSVMPAELSIGAAASQDRSYIRHQQQQQHPGNASTSSTASTNIFSSAATARSGVTSAPIFEEEGDGQGEEDDTYHGPSHHSHQQSYNAGAGSALYGGSSSSFLGQQPQPPQQSRRSLANTSFGSDIQDVAPGSENIHYSNENDDSILSHDDSFSDDDDDSSSMQMPPPSSAFSAGSILSHQSMQQQQPGHSGGASIGHGTDDLLDDDSFMSDVSYVQQPPPLQQYGRGPVGAISGGNMPSASTGAFGDADPNTDTFFGAPRAGAAGGGGGSGGMAGSSRFGGNPQGQNAAAQAGGPLSKQQFELMKMADMDTYYGGKLDEADMGFSPLGERMRKDQQ